MFYTVYKTVNLTNGKYYFGVHKTENPYDDYLGSGTYILRAVAKYGPEKFRKEVLFIFDEMNKDSAFAKEDELIQCYRTDPLCKNLRKGGTGGFDWINREDLHSTKEARERLRQILADDPDFMKKAVVKRNTPAYRKSISNGLLLSEKVGKFWLGRKHLRRSREKISAAGKLRVGARNSQFGTFWIRRDGLELKIKAVDLDRLLSEGWERGRVFRSRVEILGNR